MCFGPSVAVVMKGKLEKQMVFLCDHGKWRDQLKKEGIEIATYLILVKVRDDNFIYAFSAISVRPELACLSEDLCLLSKVIYTFSAINCFLLKFIECKGVI